MRYHEGSKQRTARAEVTDEGVRITLETMYGDGGWPLNPYGRFQGAGGPEGIDHVTVNCAQVVLDPEVAKLLAADIVAAADAMKIPVVRLSSGPGARSVSVDHHWVAAFEDSATAHAWAVAHAAKIGGTLADD